MEFQGKYKDGGFDFGDNRERVLKHAKFNVGQRFILSDFVPESSLQRRFFHGAVLAMIAYYQEGMDHHNANDLEKVFAWVKDEFNPEMVIVGGQAKKIGGSTKGKLEKGHLVEKVIDWMNEQGYKTELLVPADYKYWRDVIRSTGGPINYIDYLVEIKKLP